MPNVFIPWIEDLYGFRYVTESPWNYYGLSSGQLGIQVTGPLKFGEKQLQYVDYGLGVYNNANYKQYEQTNTRQFMSRISVYPLGAKWRFELTLADVSNKRAAEPLRGLRRHDGMDEALA